MSDSESEDLPQGGNIDPYELLGIDREATADQIKSAYRKQALRTHPGTNATIILGEHL
jgi:DnaJ homolog subfamily C member 9